uniref:Uncharacterized protein n=1 Tax=Panagrellus redivivus TaxID=6233 RepID=A0A7E4VVG4_PANRE
MNSKFELIEIFLVDYQRNTPLVNFPQDYEANRSRRPKYPESSEATSSEQTSSEEAEASVEVEAPAPADTERLPLDRISETNTRAPTKAEKKEKVDDVFSQISEGRTLRAVKRVRHL